MTARPAVLRALTDLFCLREDPIEEEIERYSEIALQIIPDAGPSTRIYVAAKLARHPHAPRAVLEKLAENDPPCATLLLEHARNFPLEAQLNAALNGDRACAVALASRSGLAPAIGDALVARNDPHVTRALADNASASLSSAAAQTLRNDGRPDRVYADKIEAKAPPAAAAPELFLDAPASERALIIAAARRAALGRMSTPVMRDEALIASLQEWAINGNWDDLASALAGKCGLRTDIVTKLMHDKGGEPLALLLALLGVAKPEAVRILLCCDTPISHSFERVRALSDITAETPATVAGALIFGMTGARPRISTYSGAPERRAAPQAEGARALEARPVAAADAVRTTMTPVVLRRRVI